MACGLSQPQQESRRRCRSWCWHKVRTPSPLFFISVSIYVSGNRNFSHFLCCLCTTPVPFSARPGCAVLTLPLPAPCLPLPLATAAAAPATGPLSIPTIPAVPGLSAFQGPTLHTAAWDSSIQLAGKKVAVVGTGASAIQVIPHLQQAARELVVFQVRVCTV